MAKSTIGLIGLLTCWTGALAFVVALAAGAGLCGTLVGTMALYAGVICLPVGLAICAVAGISAVIKRRAEADRV